MENRDVILHPPLHLPQDVNYSCIQCGESCSLFQEVVLEPASMACVREVDYRALMAEEAKGSEPWKPSLIDESRIILEKTSCGACVFQGDDKLCAIHKAHGFTQKPQTCQDFPWRFVETPGGVYAGLSFACTAVLRDEGKPAAAQREELEAQYPRAVSKRDAERAVRLTVRHEISWEAYLAIENDLAEIMRVNAHTVGERLVAQGVYLDMVVALLRESRGDSIRHAAPRTPRDVGGRDRFPPDSGPAKDADVVRAVHDRFCVKEGMPELFRFARRPRPSPALQRAFIGLITAFRQNLYIKGKPPTRVGTMTRITHHYLSHMLRLGSVNLEGAGGKFDYEAFRKFGRDFESDAEQRTLLRRFFQHRLQRKDLLLSESVWLEQRLMLMHYALLRWYSVGIASERGADRVTLDVLREAVRKLEMHYVYHTDLGKLFEKFPMLGMVLDGVARRPTFGPSMIVSPG